MSATRVARKFGLAVHDWQQRLLDTPNHRDNWGLVQLISFSDDEQLHDWLVGTPR